MIRLLGFGAKGDWKLPDAAHTASEETNSDAQDLIDSGRSLRLQGLQAFPFAGAIYPLAHLLYWALYFVRDVTYTLGTLRPVTP
jgi:hypothetical protein